MPVRAFWMSSNNFGDALNPWLYRKLTGSGPIFTPVSDPAKKLVFVGSILNWCNKDCIVWGAGLANSTDAVNPEADIRAVRGPLSWLKARDAGADVGDEVWGDPALILPKFHTPEPGPRRSVGLIPHYIDQSEVFARLKPIPEDWLVINVMDPVEAVVDAIASCDMVISSSLHGLICAHAYGVPAAWVRFSDNVGGDGFKFRDHFAAVGLSVDAPVAAQEETSPEALLARCEAQFALSPSVDTEELWNAVPLAGERILRRRPRKPSAKVFARPAQELLAAADPIGVGKTFASMVSAAPRLTEAFANEQVSAYVSFLRLAKVMRALDINFIIDAGANVGQFITVLIGGFDYTGEAYCFEPVKKFYDQLAANLGYWNRGVPVHGALGDTPGETVVNLGEGHGGTSSLLQQTENLDRYVRDARLSGETEPTTVHRVDEYFAPLIDFDRHNVLLKLDVQGAEASVIRSCGEMIRKFKAVHIEVASVAFYEGQETLAEMLMLLQELGFVPVLFSNNFSPNGAMYLDFDVTLCSKAALSDI